MKEISKEERKAWNRHVRERNHQYHVSSIIFILGAVALIYVSVLVDKDTAKYTASASIVLGILSSICKKASE